MITLILTLGIFVASFITAGVALIVKVYRDIDQLEGKIREQKPKSAWNRMNTLAANNY